MTRTRTSVCALIVGFAGISVFPACGSEPRAAEPASVEPRVAQVGAALETRTLSDEEAAALAKKAIELGMAPENNGPVVDTFITAMTAAYPPAAGAIAAAKSLLGALGLFDKHDPVNNALSAINQRLQQALARITALEGQVNEIENEAFRTQNQARIQHSKDNIRDLSNLIYAINQHPSDPAVKRAHAHEGMTLADDFLPIPDWYQWEWSDIHLWKNPATGHFQADLLPGEVKVLPTLETYASTLITWMAAIEYAAEGDTEWAKSEYGAELLKHAAFLTARSSYTREQAPETLPEQVKYRTYCYIGSFGRDDQSGECYVNDWCHDSMARRDEYEGSRDFAGDESCSPDAVPVRSDLEQALADHYGDSLMVSLVQRLTHFATYGTVKMPAPVTPPTYDHHLYGVNSNGDLLWYENAISIGDSACVGEIGDPRLHLPESPWGSTDVSSGAVLDLGLSADNSAADGLGLADVFNAGPSLSNARFDLGSTSVAAGFGGRDLLGTEASRVVAGSRSAEHICLAAAGPKKVGVGWDVFKEVVPAGGAAFYGLGFDGKLSWYRHDGMMDGSTSWRGPIPVGHGWDMYQHVFAGSDGVVYGIDDAGDLYWYRETDHDDPLYFPPRLRPEWAGRRFIAGGFAEYEQVFAGTGGVIYAVTSDGRLLWTRHDSINGVASLAPFKEIGQGWGDFKRLFTAGDQGNLYAVTQTGDVYWYQHVDWLNGSPSWRGPRLVNLDLSELSGLFATLDDLPVNSVR